MIKSLPFYGQMVYLTMILASEVVEWLLSNGWKVYGDDWLTYIAS